MPQKQNLDALIALLFKTGHIVREHTNPKERPSPTTFVQLHSLQYVALHQEKKPTMRDIAKYLNIAPPSATSIVDTLFRSGKLKRIPDKKDRRIIRIEITAQGRAALRRGKVQIAKRVKNILALLSDKEKQQLISILEKISQAYIKKYEKVY
jgi:DNA-binding MarR family transcriptional regulator